MSVDSASQPTAGLWARLPVMALMVLVLLAAGLLSAVTAMRFAIRGQEVAVPELAGASESDAARLLADSGLAMLMDGRRFSDRVPEGHVLAQDPPAGLRVKRDRRVRVRLSLGNRQYDVPQVEGSSLRSGQLILSERGLVLGNTLYSHTESAEPSTVVFQWPEAGSSGGSDPAVNVLVSLGSIDQYFVMPRLRGRAAGSVIQSIRGEGFRLGEIVNVPDSGVEPGRIVRQRPLAGTRVSKTDVIMLEVSQ